MAPQEEVKAQHGHEQYTKSHKAPVPMHAPPQIVDSYGI
jgi:hypothetical protein